MSFLPLNSMLPKLSSSAGLDEFLNKNKSGAAEASAFVFSIITEVLVSLPVTCKSDCGDEVFIPM